MTRLKTIPGESGSVRSGNRFQLSSPAECFIVRWSDDYGMEKKPRIPFEWPFPFLQLSPANSAFAVTPRDLNPRPPKINFNDPVSGDGRASPALIPPTVTAKICPKWRISLIITWIFRAQIALDNAVLPKSGLPAAATLPTGSNIDHQFAFVRLPRVSEFNLNRANVLELRHLLEIMLYLPEANVIRIAGIFRPFDNVEPIELWAVYLRWIPV